MNTNTTEHNELTPLITQPVATTRRGFIKRTASVAIVATLALGAFENEAFAEESCGSSKRYPVYADQNPNISQGGPNTTLAQIETIFQNNEVEQEISTYWETEGVDGNNDPIILDNAVVLYLVVVKIDPDNNEPSAGRAAQIVALAFHKTRPKNTLDWTNEEGLLRIYFVGAENPEYKKLTPIVGHADSKDGSFLSSGTELGIAVRIEMMPDDALKPYSIEFLVQATAGVNLGAPNGIGIFEITPGGDLPTQEIQLEGPNCHPARADVSITFTEKQEDDVI